MLTERDLRLLLTPLEQNVLLIAGREHTEDPEAIAEVLRWRSLIMAEERIDGADRMSMRAHPVPAPGEITAALQKARRKITDAARRVYRLNGQTPSRPAGNSVILTGAATPRRNEMEAVDVVPEAEGFAERIRREADEEAQRVLRNLTAVRGEIDQVVGILHALGHEAPADLEAIWAWCSALAACPSPPPGTGSTSPRSGCGGRVGGR